MNNSMMPGKVTAEKQSLEELRAQLLAKGAEARTPELDMNELNSLEQVVTEEKTMEVQGPKLVKTFTTGFNKNGFIDAIVLGFLTAVAGLTAFLYMLLNINGVMF